MVAIPVSGRLQRAGRTRRRAFGLRPVPSSSSRPFGVNPSRLPACGAARFACLQGIGARPIPAARCLAPLGEPNRHAPDRPGQRPTTRAGLGGYAGACCDRLCKCVPPSTLAVRCLAVTKDGSRGFTDMAARPCRGVPHHASSVAAAGRVRGALPPVIGNWPCPSQGRAAETVVRGCRAGHASFRSWIGPRRPCLVVNPGGGAGFVSATFQPK